MKIISHSWRSYKSKLMKIWRNQDTSFATYKDLAEEDWARFVKKYGFISIDLNCQGYKLEPFVLAKHVTQVFYVPDTTNKRLKVVIPRKQ
jgi:hypothetical protein